MCRYIYILYIHVRVGLFIYFFLFIYLRMAYVYIHKHVFIGLSWASTFWYIRFTGCHLARGLYRSYRGAAGEKLRLLRKSPS